MDFERGDVLTVAIGRGKSEVRYFQLVWRVEVERPCCVAMCCGRKRAIDGRGKGVTCCTIPNVNITTYQVDRMAVRSC